jgi:hypothetical protein
LGEGVYGGKLGQWWWVGGEELDGAELDGADGVEASVGGVREGNASDVLEGDANAAPEYRVSLQGCVPPLPSLVGLPSYEEAAGFGARQER